MICDVLKVSRSGYYAWRARTESKRARSRRRLEVLIKTVFAEHQARCGSPRIFKELLARGETCCVNTVAKYMRELDLAAKTRRKFKATTNSKHNLPVAENLLDRMFIQDAPNRVWVSDITYIRTREGWLYLATVMDLFSRKIVGWAMGPRMTKALAIQALEMAVRM